MSNKQSTPPTMRVVTESGEYQWEKLSDTAAFKPAYHIQFMNIRDTLWAFLPMEIIIPRTKLIFIYQL
jgi:hypothetical protein